MVSIPEQLYHKKLDRIRGSILDNVAAQEKGKDFHQSLPKMQEAIDEQLQHFEAGWKGTKTISFEGYQAYMNCYEEDGIYEIRY